MCFSWQNRVEEPEENFFLSWNNKEVETLRRKRSNSRTMKGDPLLWANFQNQALHFLVSLHFSVSLYLDFIVTIFNFYSEMISLIDLSILIFVIMNR